MSALSAEQVYAEDVRRRGGEDDVTAYTLSETYQSMQVMAARLRGGVFYTPEEVARPMARLAMGQALRQVGPTAQDVLRVVACDPACGCGIFLYEATHILAAQYAGRLIGRQPDADPVAAVMPRVILECVFGIEIDPVAVELTRIALALETGGALRPEMLSRHIVCANTLEGPSGPPAMEERLRRASPAGILAPRADDGRGQGDGDDRSLRSATS